MGISHLISIVGAGPGDPDLLTVKAHKRLIEADVILYDALMGGEILELAKPEAIKLYVGKIYNDWQNQEERQNSIYSLFLHWAGQNKKVVRLKTGDSMIFGRGAEEIRFCKENSLNYEVIPGITAGIASSSLFEIPLTERGKNSMVLFHAGHRENGKFTDLELITNVLKTGSPVVIYMGLNKLSDMAKALSRAGIENTIPIQVLSKISQSDEKGYETTIGGVAEFLQQNSPETPSIIIIGKHVVRI
ncbi:MAG: uroporphyrinogen-III C-methyltransferase [Bacteroidetes bacterium]|nr:uroporphyrinogen-III C-methyltransferase [Bacteroidota bacterium]